MPPSCRLQRHERGIHALRSLSPTGSRRRPRTCRSGNPGHRPGAGTRPGRRRLGRSHRFRLIGPGSGSRLSAPAGRVPVPALPLGPRGGGFPLRRCPSGCGVAGFRFGAARLGCGAAGSGAGAGGEGSAAAAGRARPAGLGHGALGVVAQGRLDHLQAPLGPGPPGELGPRQHLRHPRGVCLGEFQPDGDRIRLGPPRTCHGFKVPRTALTAWARLPEMRPGRHGFLTAGLLS